MPDEDELDRIRQEKMSELADESDAGAAESPDEPVPVTGQEHFAELLDDNEVVLADFYADWCGPCKTIAPIVEEIAAESGAAVAKVDVDANQALAAEYGVRGVPTLVVFADGEPAEQVVGARGKEELMRLVDRAA